MNERRKTIVLAVCLGVCAAGAGAFGPLSGCGSPHDAPPVAPKSAELLLAASWPERHPALASALSLGDLLAQKAPQGYSGASATTPQGTLLALSEKTTGAPLVTLFHDKTSGGWSWLEASGRDAWLKIGTLCGEPGPFRLLTRTAELERTSSAASLLWEGCIVATGRQPWRDLALRTLLVGTTREGRVAALGRARQTTSRSGIPSELKPGDFFCTKLASVRTTPLLDPESARGAIEILARDEAGLPFLATLALPVPTRREQLVGRRVLLSGEDAAPVLATVENGSESRWRVRLPDGSTRYASKREWVASFAAEEPALPQGVPTLLARILQTLAEGDAAALRALSWPSGAENEAELTRRFGAWLGRAPFIDYDATPLAYEPISATRGVLSVFARARKDGRELTLYEVWELERRGEEWRLLLNEIPPPPSSSDE